MPFEPTYINFLEQYKDALTNNRREGADLQTVMQKVNSDYDGFIFAIKNDDETETLRLWSDLLDDLNLPASDTDRDLTYEELVDKYGTLSSGQGLRPVDSPTFDGLTIVNNIVLGGTVDGRDVATDGTKLDTFDALLGDLTSAEINQLKNIDLVTITNAQWAYVGDQDQSTNSVDNVTFNTVDGRDVSVDGDQLDDNTLKLVGIEDEAEKNTLTSVGGTFTLVSPKIGSDLRIRGFNAGSGVTFTLQPNGSYTLDATGAGGGEVNDGFNVGTSGVGVYDGKNGVLINMRKLNPVSNKISIALNGQQIDFDINEANLTIDEAQITGMSVVARSGEYDDLLNTTMTEIDGVIGSNYVIGNDLSTYNVPAWENAISFVKSGIKNIITFEHSFASGKENCIAEGLKADTYDKDIDTIFFPSGSDLSVFSLDEEVAVYAIDVSTTALYFTAQIDSIDDPNDSIVLKNISGLETNIPNSGTVSFPILLKNHAPEAGPNTIGGTIGGAESVIIAPYSASLGRLNFIKHAYAMTFGRRLETYNDYQCIVGKDNAIGLNDDKFVVGDGTWQGSALNTIMRVQAGGNTYADGTFTGGGADYAEMFEWSDLNLENEDRVGYFVSKTKGTTQIEIAKENDFIIGIVSAQPSIVGNGDGNGWYQKYLRDEWGRIITEEKDGKKTPKMNPDYDGNILHKSREHRQEWDAIGMLGVLKVRDDGTCIEDGFCKCIDGGIASKSDTGYLVLKRISENIIEILVK